jgi:anaerobic magnesium-protoporphyrin IX monomethyl ester cyclase
LDQILYAARLAAESGILTVYHFLVNLPGETESSVKQTRELLDKLFSFHASKGNLGAVVFNNLRLYLGTPLTDEIIKNRLIDPRQDLLYPTYFNPPPWDHLRHELTAVCLSQGTLSYLAGSGEQGAQGIHRPQSNSKIEIRNSTQCRSSNSQIFKTNQRRSERL